MQKLQIKTMINLMKMITIRMIRLKVDNEMNL